MLYLGLFPPGLLQTGPIGVSVIMALQAHGVQNIYVSEPSEQRAERAMAAGATRVFNPAKDNIVTSIQAVSDGLGAHIVFECAGVQSALDAAFAGARGKARVIELAKYPQPVSVWPNTFNKKGLAYIQSNIYTRQEFQEVVDAVASGSLFPPAARAPPILTDDLLTGRIGAPGAMVTARIPLQDAISGGFEELLRTKDKHCKILVQSDSLSAENPV